MNLQRWISIVVVLLLIVLVMGLVLPAIQRTREEARRSTSKNNLKQIGLALLNYHETHKCLPPGGVIREDDLALHGWFTMILPFCDVSHDYAMINFQIPWNQGRNSELFEQSRPLFLIPGSDFQFTSQGFALTNYLANPHQLYRNSNVTFEQMENGTAHTWLAGEVAGNFQPWGYPFNWRPLGTKLCAGPNSYGHPPWRGGHLLFADGSVSFFSENTSDVILEKFAAAPPVPTAEQMAVPDRQFETGGFYWNKEQLLSDPKAKEMFYVRILRGKTSSPLKLAVYSNRNPQYVADDDPALQVKYTGPYFLFTIDKTTDIAEALKDSSLSEAASPAQLQKNEEILNNLQSQLPE